jgi:FtsH-binding integral membrane protein
MYFGSGLGLTGALVGALRNSSFAMTVNPWLLLFGSLGLLIGTQVVDYNAAPTLKHLLWLGFMSTMAVSLVPIINMATMPIIYDALFATGITMGGLGLVAYNAPSEQFL